MEKRLLMSAANFGGTIAVRPVLHSLIKVSQPLQTLSSQLTGLSGSTGCPTHRLLT